MAGEAVYDRVADKQFETMAELNRMLRTRKIREGRRRYRGAVAKGWRLCGERAQKREAEVGRARCEESCQGGVSAEL